MNLNFCNETFPLNPSFFPPLWILSTLLYSARPFASIIINKFIPSYGLNMIGLVSVRLSLLSDWLMRTKCHRIIKLMWWCGQNAGGQSVRPKIIANCGWFRNASKQLFWQRCKQAQILVHYWEANFFLFEDAKHCRMPHYRCQIELLNSLDVWQWITIS